MKIGRTHLEVMRQGGKAARELRHGPRSWPFWRLISARFVVLGMAKGSQFRGRRLWLYSRWGYLVFDCYWPHQEAS